MAAIYESLSIIVPVYNAEKYICKCVNSILSQLEVCTQIILVDDGSTDSSGVKCDTLAMKNENIFVKHIKNMGPGNARNVGLRYAKADYITFLDADDFLDNRHYYAGLIAEMKYDNLDIVQGRYYTVFNNSEKKMKKKEHAVIISGNENCCYEYMKKIFFDNYLWNKIFTKEAVNGIEFPQLYYSEDQCFLLQVFYNANKVGTSELIGCCHLLEKNSLCNVEFNERKLDALRAIKIMDTFLADKSLNYKNILSIDACSYVVRFYAYVNNENKENLKSIFFDYYSNFLTCSDVKISLKKKGLVICFRLFPQITSYLIKLVRLK